MNPTSSKIPITLVTGFLGSGKTTLLRQIARQRQGKKYIFLVNEFSRQGVDSANLSDAGIPVLEVVGGSIFCQCKVGDFLNHMKTLPQRFHSEEAPLDGLIIETSGLADPRAIHTLLHETGLNTQFGINQIITVIVASRFLAIVNALPVCRAQVETADRVILNKMDISNSESVEQAIALLKTIRPGIRIEQAVRCAIDIELSGREEGERFPGKLTARPNPYSTFELPVKRDIDPDELAHRLNDIGSGYVFRAKGFLPGADGETGYFDWTQDSWEFRDATGGNEDCVLVILVSDEKEEALGERIRALGNWLSDRP